MAGTTQVGQYILEKKLGQGGMAEVWKARHQLLGTYVAIKFLSPGFAGVPDIERRFLDEGKRQAQLAHPNIVSANDFLYEGQRSYLIMKLVEGESLDHRIEKLHGPMPLPEVFGISRDVLGALDYAHSQKVIHRDIKPSNILIDNDGRAYLMDFGIAVVMGERRATRTGMSIGTLDYMSPEQILASKDLDHRADIYSYGCVLYLMLTGSLPFCGPGGRELTDYEIQTRHLQDTPPPLRRLNPNVPEHVERAVLRCLEKSAYNRFSSCQDLLTALTVAPTGQRTRIRVGPGSEWDESQGTMPLPVPSIEPVDSEPTKPRQRGNAVWIISGLALVLALLAGGGYYWYTHRKGEPPPPTEGRLSVACNESCNWVVDGKAQAPMNANAGSVLTEPFGAHTISATTLDGKDQDSVSVNLSSQSPAATVTVDLGSVRAARLEREAQDRDAQEKAAQEAQEKQAQENASKTPPPAPPPVPKPMGKIYVKCNLDCNWKLDGQQQKQMAANTGALLNVPFGQHMIVASTLDNRDQVTTPFFSISSANPSAQENIDLDAVRKARVIKEQVAAGFSGRWQGEYTNLLTNQSASVNLQVLDRDHALSATMSYTPAGIPAVVCELNGIYDPNRRFLVLKVVSCRGGTPSELQGEIGFKSVEPLAREISGANQQTNFLLRIRR